MKYIFYTTAYTLQPFAGLSQTVVWCCLTSHGGLLRQQQSPELSEVHTSGCWITEQHQNQSPVFTFSVFFSHSYMLYSQGKGESQVVSCKPGCCRIRKCPFVFRKTLMIHSRCQDSQIVVTVLAEGSPCQPVEMPFCWDLDNAFPYLISSVCTEWKSLITDIFSIKMQLSQYLMFLFSIGLFPYCGPSNMSW